MKYLGKTFVNRIPEWTPEELVFNAIAWHEGYRFFGCSQDLLKAMARMKKENSDFIWLRTLLTGSNTTSDLKVVISQNKKIKFNN